MIVLVARYHCKPGTRPAVEAALQEMAPLVAAAEPGCKLYHANRSQDNPDLLLLYEHYVDEAALLGHRDTEHFKRIIEGRVIPMLEKRERELYELAVG